MDFGICEDTLWIGGSSNYHCAHVAYLSTIIILVNDIIHWMVSLVSSSELSAWFALQLKAIHRQIILPNCYRPPTHLHNQEKLHSLYIYRSFKSSIFSLIFFFLLWKKKKLCSLLQNIALIILGFFLPHQKISISCD